MIIEKYYDAMELKALFTIEYLKGAEIVESSLAENIVIAFEKESTRLQLSKNKEELKKWKKHLSYIAGLQLIEMIEPYVDFSKSEKENLSVSFISMLYPNSGVLVTIEINDEFVIDREELLSMKKHFYSQKTEFINQLKIQGRSTNEI